MAIEAEFQLRFLRDVQRVLEKGHQTTTYDFALVHALADLCVEAEAGPRRALRLPVRSIARRFVELYWPQAAPWPEGRDGEVLVQNTGRRGGSRRRAAVVRKVMEARRECGGNFGRLRSEPERWERLVSNVFKTVRHGCLLDLQTVDGQTREFLYESRVEGRGRRASITLEPGVAFCFRSFHPRVTGLARSGWARFIRQTNPGLSARGGELQEFLFGAPASSFRSPPHPKRPERRRGAGPQANGRSGRAADRPEPLSRAPQPSGATGSRRWIQEFVNRRPGKLAAALEEASAGRIRTPIEWVSPLESDDYAEYGGEAALTRLGLTLPDRSFDSFWPEHGPQWHALGRDATGAAVLVEAKASLPEMFSAPRAAGTTVKAQIGAAMEEVVERLGAVGTLDWSATFYRYTSRLAHLHLLGELNGIPAWLVFVYFTGASDVRGPESEEEWRATLNQMHRALGLSPIQLPDRRIDVFLEVE